MYVKIICRFAKIICFTYSIFYANCLQAYLQAYNDMSFLFSPHINYVPQRKAKELKNFIRKPFHYTLKKKTILVLTGIQSATDSP